MGYLHRHLFKNKPLYTWRGSYPRGFLGGYGCIISQRNYGFKCLGWLAQFSAHYIFSFFFLRLNMQHQVDSIAMMRPFVSIVCYFKRNGKYCTTEPMVYRRICETQGRQGHTEHVFLSSSRLYALRACHFRGSVLLWTQCLGHKPPWSERWNRFQPC